MHSKLQKVTLGMQKRGIESYKNSEKLSDEVKMKQTHFLHKAGSINSTQR